MTELRRQAVALEVDGKAWSAWSSVAVSRSLEEAASSFQFESFIRRAGDMVVRPGAAARVKVNGAVLLTGYVDSVQITGGRDGVTIAVAGRSRTCDLVDCMPDGLPRYHGQTVRSIAAALAQTYGVDVVADVDVGRPLASFAVQRGETVHEAIDRAAAARALLVTDDAEGRLVLTRGAQTPTRVATLAEGVNIETWTVAHDASARFSEYRLKGQRASSTDVSPELAAAVTGTATDTGSRTRILVLPTEGRTDPDAARERARWEMLTRYGRSLSVSVTVPGWETPAGELWRVNTGVRVRIPSSLLTADLLISAVSFEQSTGGSTTTLTLQPPQAYAAYVPPRPRSGGLPRHAYFLDAADVDAAVKDARSYR